MKRVKVGLSVIFAVFTLLYGTTETAFSMNSEPAANGHVPDQNQIIITKIVREKQTEIKSVSFSELVLDVKNCTYRPTGQNADFSINKNVRITADNIVFENSIIHGDLFINGNNIVLRNITVNGTVHIRPLRNSAFKFDNVTFKSIVFIREPVGRGNDTAGRGRRPEGSGMDSSPDDSDTDSSSPDDSDTDSSSPDNSGQDDNGSISNDPNDNGSSNDGQNSNASEGEVVTAFLEQALIDVYDSSLVIINKTRSLPSDWKPKDLVRLGVPYTGRSEARYMRREAAEALTRLFAGAKKDGIVLRAVSGFRSYELQKVVFAKHQDMLGTKAAERISARPGQSEHQTGLAIDISSKSMNYALDQSFENTREGKWLAENAAEFGFILRYPKGKETITGYDYEPWHFRYVGKDIAADIMKKGLTLEEYFGLTGLH